MSTVLESLNNSLLSIMKNHPQVILLGEDVLDPYGGAFKVTRGLSTHFPERVFTTPISEAGIVGIATGMAMRGMRPIAEIMFGDFLTLAADQIINHTTKFNWMYNHQVHVPLVIRTPMGGYRGYGPTHSQTLEKHFLGVPGLRVLAINPFIDAGALLENAILKDDHPVLLIEHKLLYPLKIMDERWQRDFEITIESPKDEVSKLQTDEEAIPFNPYAPAVRIRMRQAPEPSISIAAYGYMVDIAVRAAKKLAYEDEIFCEVVAPSQLTPFDTRVIFQSVSQTGRVLTVEEGTYNLGWGAEIVARCAEHFSGNMPLVRRLGAKNLPIPASGTLEEKVLPSVESVIQAVRLMV